jgi:ABC-type glycerol-3-phosphate transport system substrate-binding protein
MKKRIALLMLIALVATLLASSVSSAQLNRPGAVTASGGRYHLTVTTWRVSGSAHGGGYLLQGPARPALTGNGCCCTFLPCMIRQ